MSYRIYQTNKRLASGELASEVYDGGVSVCDLVSEMVDGDFTFGDFFQRIKFPTELENCILTETIDNILNKE